MIFKNFRCKNITNFDDINFYKHSDFFLAAESWFFLHEFQIITKIYLLKFQIKINAIFERKAFAQTKNKTTENMKLVEEVKNSDPKCDSENVDRFVKRSEEENKKVSECAKEEKENKSKSKNPEPSDVSTTDANDTVVRKSASG